MRMPLKIMAGDLLVHPTQKQLVVIPTMAGIVES